MSGGGLEIPSTLAIARATIRADRRETQKSANLFLVPESILRD